MRRVCCCATQLSIVSDRAIWLDGLVKPGGERTQFDRRIELLRISSAGLTLVEVFSTVFMIRCTIGNNCSYDHSSCICASKSTDGFLISACIGV